MCNHWLIFSLYFIFTVFKWYICYSVAVIEHYCCLIIYFIEYHHTNTVNVKSALKYCTVMYTDCTLKITCMCLLMCVCSELYWNRSRKRSVRSPWWCSLIRTGGLECAGPGSRRNRLPLWRATSAATAAPSTMVQNAVQSHIAKKLSPNISNNHNATETRGSRSLSRAWDVIPSCHYADMPISTQAAQTERLTKAGDWKWKCLFADCSSNNAAILRTASGTGLSYSIDLCPRLLSVS